MEKKTETKFLKLDILENFYDFLETTKLNGEKAREELNLNKSVFVPITCLCPGLELVGLADYTGLERLNKREILISKYDALLRRKRGEIIEAQQIKDYMTFQFNMPIELEWIDNANLKLLTEDDRANIVENFKNNIERFSDKLNKEAQNELLNGTTDDEKIILDYMIGKMMAKINETDTNGNLLYDLDMNIDDYNSIKNIFIFMDFYPLAKEPDMWLEDDRPFDFEIFKNAFKYLSHIGQLLLLTILTNNKLRRMKIIPKGETIFMDYFWIITSTERDDQMDDDYIEFINRMMSTESIIEV